MDSLTTTTNQFLIQQNNRLAHVIDLEFSLISRLTTTYSFPSSRSGMFFNGRFQEQQPYFLDACFRCKKPLGCNRDIFMYRGDTPFCSEECRSQQIEIDETKEKKRSLSASIKALRKKQEREKSNNSSPNYPLRSDAVAAA